MAGPNSPMIKFLIKAMQQATKPSIAHFEAAEAQHIAAQASFGACIAPDASFRHVELQTGGTVISTTRAMGEKLNRAAGLGCFSAATPSNGSSQTETLLHDIETIEQVFASSNLGNLGSIHIVRDASKTAENDPDPPEVEQGHLLHTLLASRGYTASPTGPIDVLALDLAFWARGADAARVEVTHSGSEQWECRINDLSIWRLAPTQDSQSRFTAASLAGFASNGRDPAVLEILARLALARCATDTELFFAFDAAGELLGSAGMAVLDPRPCPSPRNRIDGGVAEVGKVAEFYIDSTLPSARGRGVHMALIQARCTRALELGCVWAKMDTRVGVGSARNALRAGFERLYGKVDLVKLKTNP
jgi:GNAT superfamily N-acetyltransferase